MTTRMEYDADFDSLGGQVINAAEQPEEANKASKQALEAAQLSGMPIIASPQDPSVMLAQGIYRDGKWLREAEVRELTGADEEALARAGTNWPKFVATLLHRGTVHVGGQDMTPALAGELLIGDRETLILAIRRVTFGNEIDISNYECPMCGQSTELTIHLDAIPHHDLAESDNGEYPVLLRGGATATVRLPTGADQDYVLSHTKWTAAEQNTAMLQRCVVRIQRPDSLRESVDKADIDRMGMADRKTILAFLADAQPGPRWNEVGFVHEECGREVPLPLNVALLFLGN